MITVPHLHCIGNVTSTPTLTPGLGVLSDKHVSPNAAIARTKHELHYGLYVVNLFAMRVWDDASQLLPTAPAADDLSVGEGAATGFVSDGPAPALNTGDYQTTSVIRYAQGTFTLPPEYEDSGDVLFRIYAGTQGTANPHAKLDLEVFEANKEGGIGADICTTAENTINTSHQHVDFEITDSGLVASDILSFRVKIDGDDSSGSSGAVSSQITRIGILCAIRG